ncbi:MAG: hypothetical protein ABI395_04715 [Sphingobium sp.]
MIYFLSLAAATVPSLQEEATIRTVTSVIDPFLQCKRKFDPRKKALADQFAAAMEPGAFQDQNREVMIAKMLQLQSDSASLGSEIDRFCDRNKYKIIFQEKMRSIQPKYSDTENSYFSAKIFSQIENLADGIAYYSAGSAKLPLAPPPPQMPRPQDKSNNAPNK